MNGAWDELWAEAKQTDMVELAHRLGARLKRSGPHWTGPCPVGCADQNGFIVTPGKQLFYCRPSETKGDAVDMVEHVRGCSRKEALAYITGKPLPQGKDGNLSPPPSSLPPSPPPTRPAREEEVKPATTTADASRLWREASDPRGTLVERYLNDDRKLDLGADLAGEVLRWHAGIGAMLTLFRNIETGKPQAVSRTYLDPDAHKVGKPKFTGPVGGAAVMLDAFENVLAGLHVGEGVETCMTGRQRRNFKPAWALGSTTGIAKFPVLSGIEAITLIQENDDNGASQRACEACALRWHAAGREVFIDVPKLGFKDINDAIRGKDAS